MFTNLEQQIEKEMITLKEFVEGQKERSFFGVCKSDLRDFASYLDEVILNALEDIFNDKNRNIPEPYSPEEWDAILFEMIELAQRIVNNNHVEYNSKCTLENLEEYHKRIDNIEADTFATRCTLFEMLGEHIADLYVL